MPEIKEETAKPFDPLEPFRDMRDAYLDAMSKLMTDVVNTETYAQATGAMLDSCLAISAPFREVVEKSLLQALQQLSLPSREEVALLAERFTSLEMRVDDLDQKLDRISNRVSAMSEQQQSAALPEQFTRLEMRLDDLNTSVNLISRSVSALLQLQRESPAAAALPKLKELAKKRPTATP